MVFYKCLDVPKKPKFNRVSAAGSINGLGDKDWRQPHAASGDELAVLVDKPGTNNSPSEMRFLRIRADVPFVLSQARKLTPVQVGKNDSISEYTHVVLYSDGFMGAVTSRDAPQHKWLADYLLSAVTERTTIVNIYRPDVVQRLKQLKKHGLTNVTFKVQTSTAVQKSFINKLSGFKPFLKDAKKTDAVSIGIELTTSRTSGHLSDAIASEAVDLAQMSAQLERMVITGKDGKGGRETINMKHERVNRVMDVPATANDAAYYNAIRTAREEIEDVMGPLSKAAVGS